MQAWVLDRFRIERRLGSGGTAWVYAAHDTWLDQAVALKVLVTSDPTHRTLLAREFALLFGLRHPHLPVVFELGQLPKMHQLDGVPPGATILVEERCPGQPANAGGVVSPGLVATIGAQLAAALATLHARRIVHGDVKPDNVLVDQTDAPHARLIDFNLASNTPVAEVSGTLRYMAPEALAGQREAASDIYSLGATLSHLLHGSPPREQPGQRLSAPALGEIVGALTHEDPRRRATAADAFELLVGVAPSAARPALLALRDEAIQPAFVGQRPLLEAIDATLASRAGTRVLRLHGPPGSGKSAALTQAVTRAALAGYLVPGSVRSANLGELNTVERALEELGSPATALVSNPAQDVRAQRWQRFAYLSEQLSELGREGPLALVFDDVPAGSPLDQLGSFLERLGERGPRLAWIQASATPGAKTLVPLASDETAQLIRLARPLRPSDAEAGEAVWRAAGGLPQTTVTLLDQHPGDTLRRAAHDGSLPTAVDLTDSVRARLAALPAATQRWVIATSLLTPPVGINLLRRLGDGTGLPGLSAALDAGLVRTTNGAQEGMLAPVGEAVAEALRRIAEPDLVREIAELLADENSATAHAADAGRLWSMLGEPGRALAPLLSGARQATAALRFTDALRDYDAIIEFDQTGEGVVALFESARLCLALGKPAEALARLQGAANHPEARLNRAEALLALGRYRDAAHLLREPPPEGEPTGKAEALAARAAMLAGEHQSAIALAQSALQRTPDHPQAGELHNAMGMASLYRGDIGAARQALETAATLAVPTGDERLIDAVRANQAILYQKVGETEAAERCYTDSLAAARAQRDLPRQLSRLTNLATLRQETGQLEAALTGYQEAFELARLVAGPRERARVALNWANLLTWLGDADAAAVRLEPALAETEQADMDTERAYLLLVRAELMLQRDDRAAADDAVTEAERLATLSDDRALPAECKCLRAAIALFAQEARAARELAVQTVELARKAKRDRIEAQGLLWQAMADLAEPSATPDTAIAAAVGAADNAQRRTDVDVGWMANAVAARLHARTGRAQDAQFFTKKARRLAQVARSRLSARLERLYARVWFRRDLWASLHQLGELEPEQPTRDFDRLLAINRELTQDRDPDRLLERIIDAAIALSGAERGFIVLAADLANDDELEIRAARNIDHESLDGELHISRSIAQQAMQSGAAVTSINAIDDERFREAMSVHQMKLRSVLCLPLCARGVRGALYLDNRYRVSAFSETDVALLSAFGDQAAIALANARYVAELDRRSRELESSREQIEALNQRLQRELNASAAELEHARASGAARDATATGQHGMIGRSARVREVFRIIDRVADKEVAVTILGESGTGKELVARAIHAASQRAGQFVSINCGAIPAELLESELFGHEKGSFTGAVRAKPGLFEIARSGTLFLDEIGDMPLSMQVKLLRVLQQKEFRRVGGTENLATDARVISASNRDLEQMVREGGFREDLWYRLNVVEVHVPPLRERREDLPLLIEHLLDKHGGVQPPRLARAAMAALLDHDWPGNIRELENEIQRAVALAEGEIGADALSSKLRLRPPAPSSAPAGSLKEAVERFERELIRGSLASCDGRVSVAAGELGLTRAGLYKKINKYGLSGDN